MKYIEIELERTIDKIEIINKLIENMITDLKLLGVKIISIKILGKKNV